MAQVVRYICGFETGDASEITVLGAGSAVQTSVVRTGAYALQVGSSFCTINALAFLAATQSVIRVYYQSPALPGAALNIITERPTAGGTRLFLALNASNGIQVADNGATLGLVTTAGTATFSPNQWYRIEMAFDLAAGGAIKVWVDGVLDINTTHSSDVSAATTGTYSLFGRASPNQPFYDDIRIDTGGIAPIGAGQIIARQGLTGTPAYDTWTKTGAATAALCWSDTPFSAATNCNSAVSAAKQTMLVAPFSATQSGHGIETIGASDTVNAVKTAMIVKTVSGDATGQILRRVNGVDTATTFTDTAADVYHDDGIWTTTPANLDLLEAGLIHGNNTRVTTVEDVWVIVDYTGAGGVTPPPPTPPAPSSPSGGGGSTQYGRRRQRLKDQPQPQQTYNPRYEPPAPVKAQLKDLAQTAAVEKAAEVKEAPAPRPVVKKMSFRPSGPTWADMERARAELVRLKQDLIAQQDEDDVELLLLSIH